MIPMVDLKRQYHALKNEIDAAVIDVLESAQYILGPNVGKLEEEVAAYHDLSYAVSVANGTDALLLALRACDIKEGDEVITTPFTFIATAEVVALLNAVPVFVDICPDTFNLDCSQIKAKITAKTKAIIPVHLFGHPADMDPIMDIARENNLKVIEDCAQAFGAKYKGRKVGSIGDIGCFRGEEVEEVEEVHTKDEKIAERIRMLRNHGSSKRYYHHLVGYNSRLDEIQAAIVRVKLKKIDEYNEARRRNAAAYCSAINKKEIILPSTAVGCEHVYHQFTIRTKIRDRISAALGQNNISSAIYYPVPLHLQEAFLSRYNLKDSLPQAEACADEVLSLPMFPELGEEEIKIIAGVINNAF